MMNHIENITRYTAQFVDELAVSGLKEVVISPGSRSTSLALPFCEHKGIREWVIVDERSAAFFALGMAKEAKRPVALLCTSGTAAANYYPAIIEAYYSRVPLIVLTADRPHELRDVGAPQAIEQDKIYGHYVKWFHDMALPEGSDQMLAYVRSKASRAVAVSQAGNAGPVQLNFPFREPLVPDFTLPNIWSRQTNKKYLPAINGVKRLAKRQLDELVEELSGKRNGVIICGPQTDQDLGKAIIVLARALQIPILADPLSQLRSGKHDKDLIIETYDTIFRDQKIREQLKPDYIIRFGAMPVSKTYLFYAEQHKDVLQIAVEPHEGYRDPTGNSVTYVQADPTHLCLDLADVLVQQSNEIWIDQWKKMNLITKKQLMKDLTTELTEGKVVLNLLEQTPHKTTLYVGNSMSVRDLDTFFMTTNKEINVLANRGANGIDGVISSALGAASTSEDPVTLLIGDLSFYHDLNGLLAAKKYAINITIVLINNEGGGIFSFLPQAKDKKHFEALFGTPLDINFEHAIKMYEGSYHLAKDENDLQQALKNSYEEKGFSVIEIKTNREENVAWHREKWASITKELIENES